MNNSRRAFAAGLAALSLGGAAMAQGRSEKPVTAAGLVGSLIRLAEKAEIAGLKKEAQVIKQAAGAILQGGGK